jgi:hypothetical protein
MPEGEISKLRNFPHQTVVRVLKLEADPNHPQAILDALKSRGIVFMREISHQPDEDNA